LITSVNVFSSLAVFGLFTLLVGHAVAQDGGRSVKSTGTGFVVGAQGQVLTNSHVVGNCDSVQVNRHGQIAKASIIAQDRVNDLAILRFDGVAPVGPSIRANPPVRIGEQVVAFGFPLRGTLAADGTLTTGNISALAGLANDIRLLQISAPVQPGNSGSALLDLSGNVIGIVSSKLDALKQLLSSGDVPQNVNFAIKATIIQAFLDAHGVAYKTSASSSRLEIVDIAEQSRSYTVLIECLANRQINAALPQESKPKFNLPPPDANVKASQRVVLYEEEANNSNGKSYVGSAVWRTETVPPAPGQPPDIAIRADIEIPERHISVRWSMRRNDDKALPASHVVEVMFTLRPNFPHGGITNIPGMLMKQSESTRGVPLAGLTVKVTNNFFLIGLSSVEGDRARNIQSLKERAWFDIPVV
jgi:Trypsin-like peptidase domain